MRPDPPGSGNRAASQDADSKEDTMFEVPEAGTEVGGMTSPGGFAIGPMISPGAFTVGPMITPGAFTIGPMIVPGA